VLCWLGRAATTASRSWALKAISSTYSSRRLDTIVVSAGLQTVNDLAAQLDGIAASVHTIGGADLAVEIDAKRAIDQGTRLAAQL
jgi:hypothetical protein